MKLLDQHYQRIKNGIHGIQGFGVLVAWIITIAVFTRDGKSGGPTKYFFALCWFTIPLLIYQTAVPTFTRTKRFSNPYAHAILDILFTILWLAAFAAVAAWTNAGIKAGDDPKKSGCDDFGYGSPGKCKLSRGEVGCGVILCILFALTSALSLHALLHYRRHGSLPYSTSSSSAVPIADQTKYAFSSAPPNDPADDAFDPDFHNADEHNDAAYDPHPDQYHSLRPDTDRWDQPQQSELAHEDTSYHGPQDPFRNPSPSPYRPPSAGTYDHGAGAPQLPPLGGGGGGGGDPFRDDLALSHDHGGYGGGSGRVDIPDASDYRPR